jgi:sulfite exporter TauE/SafE
MNGELAGITGPGAALVAGLITSVHCAGMCGPLACALMPVRREEADPHLVSTIYHATRLAGYTLLGALVGGIGRWPLSALDSEVARYLPWLLVLFFVAMALRLEQRLPRLPILGRVYGALATRLRGGSRLSAAAVLGAATPLLPCGPLYFLLSLALLSGSAAQGAETLLAFGLGTVPLLWLAQTNFHWLRSRLGPQRLATLRTVFAFAVAAVIAWRLRGTLGLGGPGINDFACF